MRVGLSLGDEVLNRDRLISMNVRYKRSRGPERELMQNEVEMRLSWSSSLVSYGMINKTVDPRREETNVSSYLL